MSGLSNIKRFVVPRDLVEKTLAPIQKAGQRGYEAFVLWGGRAHGEELEFVTGYVPKQRTMQTEAGLLVTVDGEALFQANKAFFDAHLILAAQVHSHPTAAYHSEVDDANPLMTLIGGLSGVIPNFGSAGLDGFAEWAWYSLNEHAGWDEMDQVHRTIDLVS